MAYYYAPRARPRNGLAGLFGLGEEGCDQPVSAEERDALVDQIKGYTNPWFINHFTEGHPDLIALFRDIQARLAGLEPRAKLLRCDAEARDRAGQWIGQIKALCRKVKTDPAHCSGETRVLAPFDLTVYRGPTYHVRPTTDPAVCAAMTAQLRARNPTSTKELHHPCERNVGASSAAAPPSAPPGSVVIGGQVYESSAAARAAQEAASSGATTTTTTTAPVEAGAGAPLALPSFLEGNVAGIPVKYLALGLAAYMLMKRR